MPKNLKQEIIYTFMMVIVMVYGMICYNIALSSGGMQNFVFTAALSELPIMGIAAFLLDFFIVGHFAKHQTFKIFVPEKSPMIFIILSISILSICLMCPLMSFIATVLFKVGFCADTISTWLQTTVINFPMAFFWQLVIAGPLIRFIFGKLFPESKK